MFHPLEPCRDKLHVFWELVNELTNRVGDLDHPIVKIESGRKLETCEAICAITVDLLMSNCAGAAELEVSRKLQKIFCGVEVDDF